MPSRSRSSRGSRTGFDRLEAPLMGELTSQERACVEAASAEPMLIQVEHWAEINSGSRNLEGLAVLGARLADSFADLPGEIAMREPAPVEAIDANGKAYD